MQPCCSRCVGWTSFVSVEQLEGFGLGLDGSVGEGPCRAKGSAHAAVCVPARRTWTQFTPIPLRHGVAASEAGVL